MVSEKKKKIGTKSNTVYVPTAERKQQINVPSRDGRTYFTEDIFEILSISKRACSGSKYSFHLGIPLVYTGETLSIFFHR
jgi:hypothetical protein